MGCTEIDGRIDGERRKYIQQLQLVLYIHSNSAAVMRTCIHIYCKFTAPIEIKINRPCKYFNDYNKYLFFTILYMYMYYFLKRL